MIIRATNYLKLAFVAALREAFGSTVTPTDYRYGPDENDPTVKLRIYRAFPRRQFNPPCLVINADASDARFRYLDEEIVSEIYRVYEEQVINDSLQVTPIIRIASIKDSIGNTYVEDTNFTYSGNTNTITWLTPLPPPSPYFATYDTRTFTNKYQTVFYGKKVQSQIVVPIRISIYALSTTDRERITDLVILYVRSVFRDKFKPFCTYINIQVGGETQEDWSNQPLYINTVTVDCWTQYASEIAQDMYALINSFDIDIAVRTLMEE